MREFVNSVANHLGIPLPAGRMRFYRQDQDGQVEFTGENQIEHTPKDETVRVFHAQRLLISRASDGQTKFQSEKCASPAATLDESFEIKLRNHKTEASDGPSGGTPLPVEQLGDHAGIGDASGQTDSKTMEYEVTLQLDEERTLTYTAHYTW